MSMAFDKGKKFNMFEMLRSIGDRLQIEIRIFRLVLKDERTPQLSKCLLGLALAYALSPLDLIPDFIPILGQLDDLIIAPALLILALKLIPQEIVDDCRAKVMADEMIATQIIDRDLSGNQN
ncbi:MAG: hypothetical protein BGO99_02825 [Nitrosospira sp. 56-18]|jgi:uncharacterized membrane protein YkvA (DUF1232 family)|nr:MAG: hypothetical protein BGO99_02825 [Nitrosospira sp. 56-18]